MENLFWKKTSLQDLVSSLKAVISTNESTEFITGHMLYNLTHTYKFQLKISVNELEFEQHWVLGSFWFHWCSFHSFEVSKKYWNICLMRILCTTSLAHAFFHVLWSLMTLHCSCRFGSYEFIFQTQKMHEPRTRYIWNLLLMKKGHIWIFDNILKFRS